jgi:hypothetical protein
VEAHDSIRARGAKLVVVFNADVEMVSDWKKSAGLPPEVLVVADPEAMLYRELGTERSDPVRLMIKGFTGAIRSARDGLWSKPTRADMLRLGADVAVDADGNISLLHLASGPDDRLPTERLLAALDEAEPIPRVVR